MATDAEMNSLTRDMEEEINSQIEGDTLPHMYLSWSSVPLIPAASADELWRQLHVVSACTVDLKQQLTETRVALETQHRRTESLTVEVHHLRQSIAELLDEIRTRRPVTTAEESSAMTSSLPSTPQLSMLEFGTDDEVDMPRVTVLLNPLIYPSSASSAHDAESVKSLFAPATHVLSPMQYMGQFGHEGELEATARFTPWLQMPQFCASLSYAFSQTQYPGQLMDQGELEAERIFNLYRAGRMGTRSLFANFRSLQMHSEVGATYLAWLLQSVPLPVSEWQRRQYELAMPFLRWQRRQYELTMSAFVQC